VNRWPWPQQTGLLKRDLALTRNEVAGIMAGLLTSEDAPTGASRLREGLAENGNRLVRFYASEMGWNLRLPRRRHSGDNGA